MLLKFGLLVGLISYSLVVCSLIQVLKEYNTSYYPQNSPFVVGEPLKLWGSLDYLRQGQDRDNLYLALCFKKVKIQIFLMLFLSRVLILFEPCLLFGM